MAATVEGTFILIDRASGPARRIKGELRELEVQARRTGRTMDDSIGTPRQARALDQTARETAVLGDRQHTLATETHGVSGAMRETRTEMRRTDRDARGLGTTVRVLGNTLRALGTIMNVLKWPAMIAGVGGATQAVVGLGAAAVALTPKLLDAGGAAVGLIPLYAGLGGAIGATMLATAGLSEAMGGNREAMKRLTPEARAFVEVLRSYRGEVNAMRRGAQQSLFPGLEDALQQSRTAMPGLRRIIRQQAGDVGNLARFGAGRITQPGFMQDLSRFSDQAARSFGGVARGGVYMAEALMQVSLAAEPFTDWMTTGIEHLGKMASEEAKLGRQTGELGRFFDRTQDSLETLGSIGENTLGGLGNVMGAARQEGDSLWKSIDHSTESFEKWTGSFRGQVEMRRFFYEMRPVVSETAGLVGDIAGGFADIARGPEGAMMLRELRAAVPELVSGIRELTAGFGPTMIRSITDILGLLAELAGHNGPLRLMAEALGLAARAATELIQRLGPLGDALLLAFGARAILSRVAALQKLAGAIRGVNVASAGGTMGGAVPMAAPAAAGAGGGGMIVGGVPMRGAPAAAPIRGPMSPGGVILPAGPAARAAAAQTAARAGGAGLLARGRGAIGRVPGLLTAPGGAGRLLMGAARFAGPAALLMGALQGITTPGGAGAKAQGAASGLTFGVIPRPISAEERTGAMQGAVQDVIGDLPQGAGLKSQRRAVGRLQGLVDTQGNAGQAFGDIEMDHDSIKEGTEMLRTELRMRRQLLRETVRGQNEELRRASIEHANRLTTDFGRAFNIRSKQVGPAAAMDRLGKDVGRKLEDLRPAGRKILSENMLAWGAEMARRNPALKDEVERLEKQIKQSWSRTGQHVTIVNGRILTGSRTEWKNIRESLTTQTEIARQEVSADFTAIQREAVGSLKSMGFSDREARSVINNLERGGAAGAAATNVSRAQQAAGPGNRPQSRGGPGVDVIGPGGGRARGGRIPGTGMQDSVHLGAGYWGAPSELIVNQHAERDADAILMERGLTLDKLVRGEYKRHSTPPTSRPRRGFARGGRYPGSYAGGMSLGGLHPGIAAGVRRVLTRFPGLRVTSTTGGGHAAGSYHYRGLAADIGGDAGLMHEAAGWLDRTMGTSLAEGIHNPNLSIKGGRHVPPSFWGASTWGDHRDHIHMAIAGALGLGPAGGAGLAGTMGGGMRMRPLKGRHGSRGGLPGAAHDLATTMYARGLTQAINKSIGGGAIPMGDVGAGGNLNQWLTEALRITHHYSPGNLSLLRGRAMQESGGNPNAVNNWDSNARRGTPSIGLLQTIGPTFSSYALPGMTNIRNPVHNAVAAIRYMMARYGHIVGPGGGGYSLGGRIPEFAGWFGKGGDFTVNRPTIFGAGENGRERVTISRAGGGRGPVRVVMERGAVQVHAGGADAEAVGRIVEDKLDRFADMVVEAVGSGDEETEEVMA